LGKVGYWNGSSWQYVPGSSGGGGSTPTALFLEDANVDETLNFAFKTGEDANADDLMSSLLLKTGEDVNVNDELSVMIASPRFSEDANANDLMKLIINDIDVARTGTPDSDLIFDAYVNQANAATNFGNANLQVKHVSVTPGSDEKRGLIALNLTSFANMTAVDGATDQAANPAALLLTFTASTTAVLGQSVGLTPYLFTSSPFTESTINWNNKPTFTTTVNGGDSYSPTTTPTRFTFGIAAGDLQAALGNWIVFRFLISVVTDPGIDTITVISRDQAANRPLITLNYLQRGT